MGNEGKDTSSISYSVDEAGKTQKIISSHKRIVRCLITEKQLGQNSSCSNGN